MKTFYLVGYICLCLSLAACTTTPEKINAIPPTTIYKKNPDLTTSVTTLSQRKNPLAVTIFTHGETPKKPYIVLGKETVSKFNFAGAKRQEAHIREAMRQLAANLGGDAIINLTHDTHSVSGTVIAFKA